MQIRLLGSSRAPMPADQICRASGKPLRRGQEITKPLKRFVIVQAMHGAGLVLAE